MGDTSDLAESGPLEKADVKVGRKMASHRDEPAVKAAAKAGKLGDQEPLYALAGVLMAAGLLSWRPRIAEAGVRIGFAVFIADLMKSGLKKLVTRTRPHVLMDEGRYEKGVGGGDAKKEQSFPSGHMAGSTAAALAARSVYPGIGPIALAACGLLGWSRVSKGAHWPSDVAAGAVTGVAAAALSGVVISSVMGRPREAG